MSTNIDKLTLEIASRSKQANDELGSLITKLERLSKMTTNTGDALKNTSRGINSLRGAFNKLNGMDLKKTEASVKKLSKSLSILSKSSTSLSSVSKELKLMASSINSLSRAMGKLESANASKNLDLSKMSFTINKYQKMMGNTSRGMNRMNTLGGADMLANLYMFSRLAYGFRHVLDSANDYIETLNLFNVVMGESTRKGNEFIKSLETIGVDMEQAMHYQGSFYDIGKSLGMSAKNAYTLSEQFTKLAYDYSSLYNINVDVAFQKLQAAIVGTVEPIRRLGKDISEARLREIAFSLGIEENVRSMTASEKATLRFIAVMQQSGSAMNDMERTINSPANALRVLRAQFRSLSRELGNLFVPILTSVLPYLIAFAKVLREIARDIAALFGIKQFEVDFNTMNDSMGAMDIGSGDLADNLDKAGNKAKKLKDHLLGIDELNVLNDTSTGGTGGGGTPGMSTGGDLGLDLEKFGYKNVLAEVSSKADEIYEKFRKFKAPLAVALGLLTAMWATNKISKFAAALTNIIGMSGFGGLAAKLFSLAGTGGIVGIATTALVGLGDSILGTFGVITGSTVVAGLTGLAAVLGVVTGAALAVHEGMQPAIRDLGLVWEISDGAKTKLEPMVEAWSELDKNIKKLDWSNKVITDKDYQYVTTRVEKMVNAVLKEVDADRNQELQDIELLKNVKGISEETYQEMINSTNAYYDGIASQTENAEKRIQEILKLAKEEKRALKDSEVKEIGLLQDQIRDNAVTTMSESEEEQMRIMTRLKHNQNALTVEAGSELLLEARKNKENQLQEAEDTRIRMLAALDRRFGDQATMDNEEYARQYEAIQAAYNDQVAEAETGYEDINEAVKNGLGDQYKYIDEKTGEIKSRFTVFIDDVVEDWNNFVNGIKKAWTDMWDDIYNWFNDIVESIKTAWDNFIGWIKEKMKVLSEYLDMLLAPFKKFFEKLGNSNLNPFNWFSSPFSLDVDYGVGNVETPNIMAYARGGFIPSPSGFVSPDLWTAGEAGKELIGSYQGKTTVMPLENTSFVSAIYSAVYDATVEAYSQKQTQIYVQPQVKIGGKDIKQAQEEYNYTSGGGLVRKI